MSKLTIFGNWAVVLDAADSGSLVGFELSKSLIKTVSTGKTADVKSKPKGVVNTTTPFTLIRSSVDEKATLK